MLHALVVEDDGDHAALACDALAGLAHVVVARDHASALTWLQTMAFDVVISDLGGVAPGGSWIDHAAALVAGIDRARRALRVRRAVPLILASGVDPSVLHTIAGALTHTHACPKPYSRRRLRALVETLTTLTTEPE